MVVPLITTEWASEFNGASCRAADRAPASSPDGDSQRGEQGLRIFGIGTINSFLVAAYLVPSWLIAAGLMTVSPVRGLYDVANIGPAIFVVDHLQLFAPGTLRFAQFLALAKITAAAFLLTFMVSAFTRLFNGSSDGREQMFIGLGLAGVISFVSLLMAAQVGEVAALRLHATETMLVAGALIVLMVEPDPYADESDAPAGLPDAGTSGATPAT